MEKKLGTILLAFALLCPSFLFSQTRICVINECRYSDNTNKFLRLAISHGYAEMQLFLPNGSRENQPIEQYLFYGKPGVKTKTGIKNRQAADIVTAESGRRLTEKGYDTVIPTNDELATLWNVFRTSQKKQLKESDVKNRFRQYLCDYYRAEMLVALTSSPFDMEIGSNKTKKDTGKAVDAKMTLSCVNTWDVYCPKEKKTVKTFKTSGNDETYWNGITKYNVGKSLANKVSNYTADDDYWVEGSWAFIPYIVETAADAAEFFEQNL